MSWAADNPEGYDQVLKNAVCARLIRALKDIGVEEFDGETLDWAVEAIQKDAEQYRGVKPPLYTSAWDGLVLWASNEIPEFEADYLMGGR